MHVYLLDVGDYDHQSNFLSQVANMHQREQQCRRPGSEQYAVEVVHLGETKPLTGSGKI